MVVAFLFAHYSLLIAPASAFRIDELKSKISEHNQEIEGVQKEIEEYQQQINQTLKEAASLGRDIRKLEITRKKLASDVYLTKNQIGATELTIEQLGLEISLKTKEIGNKKDVLAEIIRAINESEMQSIVEITLAHDNFSDFFNDLERMKNLQNEININLTKLKELKKTLQEEKTEQTKEKERFENLRARLTDQKILVERNKSKKDNLLRETKNKESNYRKILNDRLARQKALEEEISELEEQLRIEIDPTSLPSAGSGVLKWPLDNIFITQYFGNTPFATQNPQVYNGNGHRGVDFRASIGTPVKSTGNGVVRFVYKDQVCPNAYYGGKWILIDHNNNLSTLYAHLSLIKVAPGQTIKTGQVIGYSGETGYVTGPHLHFTVFASKAVRITGENGERPYISRVCGKELKIPLAPNNGYLNPLSYL